MTLSAAEQARPMMRKLRRHRGLLIVRGCASRLLAWTQHQWPQDPSAGRRHRACELLRRIASKATIRSI